MHFVIVFYERISYGVYLVTYSLSFRIVIQFW